MFNRLQKQTTTIFLIFIITYIKKRTKLARQLSLIYKLSRANEIKFQLLFLYVKITYYTRSVQYLVLQRLAGSVFSTASARRFGRFSTVFITASVDAGSVFSTASAGRFSI